jgi:glycogen debranching enzyme
MQPAPTAVLHAGYTVLCASPDGMIDGDPTGLFDYDTRIISTYRLTVDGRRPELVGAARPESEAFVARYRLPRAGGSADGPVLPQDAVEIDLERVVGSGMWDRWSLRNHSAVEWEGTVRLDIRADFADVAEVGRGRRQHGDVSTVAGGRSLELRYRVRRDGRRLDRAARVRVVHAPGRVAAAADGLRIELRIPPREGASFEVRVSSRVGGRWRSPAGSDRAGVDLRATRARWRARRVRIEGPDRIRAPFERAVEDLYALRNGDLEHDLLDRGPLPPRRRRGWVVNAGVPRFTGFFGRDSLTAGWQAAMAGTDALLGALEVAAATQATADDPWRDAEPGKMLHELRRGPLAMLGITPRDAYYGSQTTPAIFVLVLSELWHWTGSDALLRRFRDAALRAIEWADRAREAGGGFLAYERRSPAGLRNQGWKDSDEAIRHADGRIAEPPIATVEEQAFHFLALQRMAEILVALEEPAAADDLLARAADLRRRWHDAFWMPEEGFYALALDAHGEQVRSITSNPGHALGTGIVPPRFARRVATRLLDHDLFSGWGVRTLASGHPSYNPLAYHLGTVWPVENATFALGCKRYGLDAQVDRISGAVLDAAAAMSEQRLPEALTGHPRELGLGPAPYPDACAPQAWSASAVVQLVQLMLGLYPFAPLRVLALVRPRLPEWLPEVTLRNVRVGRATVDLRFSRYGDGSASHTVLRSTGSLLVVPAGPPVDVSGQSRPWLEVLGQAALERAPGRLVRAARIAVGLE